MISLVQCRKVLKADEKNLTDEEVLELRDILHKLATINIEFLEEFDRETKSQEDESSNLHSSIH